MVHETSAEPAGKGLAELPGVGLDRDVEIRRRPAEQRITDRPADKERPGTRVGGKAPDKSKQWPGAQSVQRFPYRGRRGILARSQGSWSVLPGRGT